MADLAKYNLSGNHAALMENGVNCLDIKFKTIVADLGIVT